ncbi:SDR family NAD(P)-dependent oxidoreductase [Furfurilactobacillus siliginis]|uniref:Short-chain dehydrogenase n=1 Tax=Furfurilactobacillus siliginis TaxID=348151 RepID=A0A0R2LBT6_9LACO|nr:SDR family NAD(P)-dependent oxidoreductase [Furfurilactobacillus siliginis]KRN97158.1 hypothetical protein IV55_GL000077 [Furfurilactobacillus siliginis]GEK29580.1 hypothetical protein LSI01_18910 [Furfurilactobacillus siliginis]
MANPILAIVGVGNTGLAQAQASLFGQHGFDIALVSRDQTIMNETAAQLANEDINATVIPTDLTKPETIAAAFEHIKQLGQLTAVIFNATYRPGILPSQLTTAEATTGMLIGAVAPIAVAAAALPQLQAIDAPTALLFTNSIAAAKPFTNAPLQSMEKAAMTAYVKTLNDDLSESNVFAGLVTINTFVRTGHRENQDPKNIAKAYYKLFQERTPVELPYHDLIEDN